MLEELLYRFWTLRKVARHERHLRKVALIGENVNKAKRFGPSAIMKIKVYNASEDPRRLKIERNCTISCNFWIAEHGWVSVGDHVFMNRGCRISCIGKVSIGARCLFGPEVVIWEPKNHLLDVDSRRKDAWLCPSSRIDPYKAGGSPISIEEDVWLATRVIVLSGVTVGKGSVVGAGSVVTKSIPAMSVAVGNPARVIKKIDGN